MREHTSLAENWPRLSFASYFRYRGWSSVIVTITWQCLDTVMVGYFSGLWRDSRREGRIYEVSSKCPLLQTPRSALAGRTQLPATTGEQQGRQAPMKDSAAGTIDRGSRRVWPEIMAAVP